MSWNIKKKGTPAEVAEAVEADSGAQYMPEALLLLIDELLRKTRGPVELFTHGHVYEGIGDVHLVVMAVPAEAQTSEPAAAEPEVPPAGDQAGGPA